MDLQYVYDLLKKHHHCVIASASTDGHPWVSPVFFNYEEPLRIVWESARGARHSRLVADNPRVAIVVGDLDFKGNPSGVYLECLAREVPVSGLEDALRVFLDGPHEKSMSRSVTDYLDEKPLRLYEAVPEALYGLRQVETEDGYVIDERVEIPLASA